MMLRQLMRSSLPKIVPKFARVGPTVAQCNIHYIRGTAEEGSHALVTTPNEYYRGHHCVLDVTNAICKGNENVDKMGRKLLEVMATAARDAGANVLMTHIEVFGGENSPPGFASVVLLDESHITAHCYSDTGLIAIDAFTCGKCPASTERVTEDIAKHIINVFPDANLDPGALRRFGDLNVPKYLKEYYSGDILSNDNESLLKFFHGAYSKIASERKGEPFRLLEVGGGPTMYQLLSASAHASEITFTDMLQKNIKHVEKRVREASRGDIGGVLGEWGLSVRLIGMLLFIFVFF